MTGVHDFLIVTFCVLSLTCPVRGQSDQTLPPEPAEKARTRQDPLGVPLPPGVLSRLGTYRLRHGGNLHSVAFSPDGKTVASAGGGSLRLWDLASGKEVGQLTGQKDMLRSVEFSPDGKTLVAAGLFTDALYFWDAVTGKYLRHVGELPFGRESRGVGPTTDVHCLAFSSDGKNLAHVRGGDIGIHDATTGKERSRIKSGRKYSFDCAAFSPNGKFLATGDSAHFVRLWSPDGTLVRTLPGHNDDVVCLAFSPDGAILVSGAADGQLRLWDAHAGKELRPLRGHKGPVLSVHFTNDGKGVLSGGYDRVSLWDVATGVEARQFAGHNGRVKSLFVNSVFAYNYA